MPLYDNGMARRISIPFNALGKLATRDKHRLKKHLLSPAANSVYDMEYSAMMMVSYGEDMPVAARIDLSEFELSSGRKKTFNRNRLYAVYLGKGLDEITDKSSEYGQLSLHYQSCINPDYKPLHSFAYAHEPFAPDTQYYHLDARDTNGQLKAFCVLALHGRAAFALTHVYHVEGRQTSLGRFVVLASLQLLKESNSVDYAYLGDYSPIDRALSWKSELAPMQLAHVDHMGNIDWITYNRSAFEKRAISPFHWGKPSI